MKEKKGTDYLKNALYSLNSYDFHILIDLVIDEVKSNIFCYRKDVDLHDETKQLLDLLNNLSNVYVNLIINEQKKNG